MVYPANYFFDGQDRCRSLFLVNTNIATDSYISLKILNSDISAIRFAGDFGHLSIFNIYNEITNNDDITALTNYLEHSLQIARPTATDHMIWLGDFNRHHELWEPDANANLYTTAEFIQPLLDVLFEHDMIMALPAGIPTLFTPAGNWTRPDNVWRNRTADDPIVRCHTQPAWRPAKADHLPIITILDLPVTRSSAPPLRDFRNGDYTKVSERLETRLTAECPARRIETAQEFEEIGDKFMNILTEVIEELIPATNPSPHTKRWWTRELTDLRWTKNKLSNIAFRFRAIIDHPAHAALKKAENEFKEAIDTTRTQHWVDWLENISLQDVYIANKYVAGEPTDYSRARVPSLATTVNGVPTTVDSNEEKSEVLAESFFPPPPATPTVPAAYEYPEPLPGIRFFSRDRIRQAVRQLHSFKAPGPDGIPNVVLKQCIDVIIHHLYYLFKAVFELNVYHSRWLKSTTLVLRKPSKPAYDVAKAYRPIGLLDTIGKLLSTLVANDLSFLAEKHNMLPPTQFGGRPGRNTTDAMHIVTQAVKDAWRNKKVAAALFLDIKSAFPNTVRERLIHNMKARGVPTCYISLFDRMLTERWTQLRFDDYTSDLIRLINGTTQGCPLSMLFYSFYNAPLIEVASHRSETSVGFVDDSIFVAVAATLDECHQILKDMMERPNGGFEWSTSHNSPFALDKVATMDFPRTASAPASGPLSLRRDNGDGTHTTQIVTTVQSYKYLGVIFEPNLRWKAQSAKVTTKATWWTSQVARLGKVAGGMPPSKLKQLYNTVAVPAITYAADIWYTGIHKSDTDTKTRGSVGVTGKLRSIQRRAAKYITGALATTAGDVMDAHAHILPTDLLFHKVLFRAAARICSLPRTHPLYPIARRTARHYVNHHRSPLHQLFHVTKLRPDEIETITPIRRRPSYRPSFEVIIKDSKKIALTAANELESQQPIRVYCDGSGYEGGVGAAAILYIGPDIKEVLYYHLGSTLEHTVYEAESVGILMGIHMLTNLQRQLREPVAIGSDSQAVLRALTNQRTHAGQYLLDYIHDAAEKLHAKQDGLFNVADRRETRRRGETWTGRKRGVIEFNLHWVPGHVGFAPNERADEEAKKAAKGRTSEAGSLPATLRNGNLPVSISALRQEHREEMTRQWTRRWKRSPRYQRISAIDRTAPSKKFLRLITGLNRRQSSIITQLRTDHIPLNRHLFRIKRSDTPSCPHCQGITVETVHHFLFDCPQYRHERHILQRRLRRNAGSLKYLLSQEDATIPLLKYVHATGRLKSTYGALI